MVKKLLANTLFYLMITSLVIAIALLAGFITSNVLSHSLGLEWSISKAGIFYLLFFVILTVFHVYDAIIERLKGMSE